MKSILLYSILWIAGIIVAGLIIFMPGSGKREELLLIFGDDLPVLKQEKADYKIVSDLLLSASELNISRNMGMIDFNNKDTGLLLTEEMKTNPEQVYNRILRRKLENIRSRNTDFSVKPVPK
jgi:hypothetical protein